MSRAEQGIASHWPYGRGVYISEDRGFVVWVGEQDHLRIMATERTTVLNRVFDRLYVGLQALSTLRGVKCAVSDQFGAITSCPVCHTEPLVLWDNVRELKAFRCTD